MDFSGAGRMLGKAGAWGQRASHPVGTAGRQHLTFTVSFNASTADGQCGKKAGNFSVLHCTLSPGLGEGWSPILIGEKGCPP